MLWGRPITSGAGAMGVMQLMHDTYSEMSLRNGLGSDPYNVHDNILAGTAYLRELYNRYGYPRLFEAYNAGPAVLEAHMQAGHKTSPETRNYVQMAVAGTATLVPRAAASHASTKTKAAPAAKITAAPVKLASATVAKHVSHPVRSASAHGTTKAIAKPVRVASTHSTVKAAMLRPSTRSVKFVLRLTSRQRPHTPRPRSTMAIM